MRPVIALTGAAVLAAAVIVPAVGASAQPAPATDSTTATATPRPYPTWFPTHAPRPTASPTSTTTPAPAPTASPTHVPTPTPTSAPTSPSRYVLRVDASKAPTYEKNVDAALAVWNGAVPGLALTRVEAGAASDIVITEGHGWPAAWTTTVGKGKILVGSDGVTAGFDVTRIVAHEMGHVLGLPDRKNGDCPP